MGIIGFPFGPDEDSRRASAPPGDFRRAGKTLGAEPQGRQHDPTERRKPRRNEEDRDGSSEGNVKQADKRDSVTARKGYDDHSSRRCVVASLEPPTRRLGGPLRRLPPCCCYSWNLSFSTHGFI